LRKTHGMVAMGGVVALLAGAGTASAATKDVSAGPPVERPPAGIDRDAGVNAFYPRSVAITTADRVRFTIRGFHNIVFPPRGQRAPALLMADPANPVTGALDAAGAPFWFNGQPRLLADPSSFFPVGGNRVTGARLVGSGIPQSENPPPFRVSFARTGSYTYFCTVHPGMRGTVRVVRRGQRVPPAAADRRTAERQLARDVRALRRLQAFDGPAGSEVRLGNDAGEPHVLRFFPAQKTVRVGETVNFAMSARTSEAHTATFGPAPFLQELTRTLIGPAPGGPPTTLVFDARTAYPSDPPPLPPLAPTSHGNGFVNTGVLDGDPASPNPASASITFGAPGTYAYICVLHPEEMKATITVTP
jgi:plastocyanin